MRELADNPVRHRVRSNGEGRALLDYLLELLQHLPPDEVLEAVSKGRFRLEKGETLSADSILSAGQLLLADVPGRSPADPFLPPPPQRLHELFRDEHLLAVCKPAGLLCHPMGTHKVAALSIAARQLQLDGEPHELRPLHRLDRETSGVLLMARNHRADVAIKQQFEKRSIKKSYLALVCGRMQPGERLVDAPIGADNGPIRIRMRVDPDGKTAQTRLRPLQHFADLELGESSGGYTWVQALPATGRTHQIRVHLAHIGHPIVGDKLYCGDGTIFLKKWRGELSRADIDAFGLPRQALHAESLCLQHPVTGKDMRVTAPPAEDLLEFARRHGSDWPTSLN